MLADVPPDISSFNEKMCERRSAARKALAKGAMSVLVTWMAVLVARRVLECS